MNSDQLLKFIAIADHKTMTAAAESLFITQSALSHTLSDLESELGCKLFFRDKKNLVLTSNGEKLLLHARNISNIMNQASSELNRSEKISIAAVNICAAYMLANYPEDKLHNISLLQMPESEMPMALMKEDVDIVACDDIYLRHYRIPGLKKFLLCREQLGLLVPPDHKFYDRNALTYADLENEPLCMRSDFISLRTWLDNLKIISGTDFNIEFNMDRYTYLTVRDKISYPEIRQMSSITRARQQTDVDYRYVKIEGVYSSRYIHMWYLDTNFSRIEPIIESVKKYYQSDGRSYTDNLAEAILEENDRPGFH